MEKGRDVKPHIGIFGRRNIGKSSFINKLAGQDIAIVSNIAGTTTDPVKKSFEISGFGPVILIDTAGIDDIGELGEKRIQKTLEILKIIDLAILIISHNNFGTFEQHLISEFKKWDIPYIIIHNKSDIELLSEEVKKGIKVETNTNVLEFNYLPETSIESVIHLIRNSIPESSWKVVSLVGNLISYGDIVLLITPIDIQAPEGRLILPQIQTIRDILDNDGVAIVLKEREVDAFLRKTHIKPKLAITDSQIFLKADAAIPKDIPLTGFSVLFAHYKGDFPNYLKGTPTIKKLKDNDRILLLESCTHHVSCDDIGRVKIPRWISDFTGKKLDYDVIAGLDKLQRPITDYALVIQCGGCMITRKQIINRLRPAVEAGIPVSNYGMTIAYVQGIFDRAIAPFISKEVSETDYL
jgi:[FeFe] hydrogenase H-cluster maturation GTPase HydF